MSVLYPPEYTWTLESLAERNLFWNKVRATGGRLGPIRILVAYFIDETHRERVTFSCSDSGLYEDLYDHMYWLRSDVALLEACGRLKATGEPEDAFPPTPRHLGVEFHKPSEEYL